MCMASRRSLSQLLQWLIAGTRGGVNRARIIHAIHDEPRNANQLSTLLGVDYRTIRYHLDVLVKNRLVTSMGETYGTLYFLAFELEEHYDVFEEIWERIGKRLKRKEQK